MSIIAFVVWLIGWPLACSASDYLEFLRGERYSQSVKGLGAFVSLFIWLVVACMVWNKC